MIPSPAVQTRLEKAAADNGFDRRLPPAGDWLAFGSTQVPLTLWLTAIEESAFAVALSQAHVARELREHGDPSDVPLPPGASAARVVADIPGLHRLVRRAFQLSKTLPDALLASFQKKVAALPRTTEAERLVVQRVGQDLFREGLLDYWQGRCAVTGLDVPDLLRASHIKPWSDCDTDAERLDVFNGLLLAPHLDAAFDRGFITVADDGSVMVSSQLPAAARSILSLDSPVRVAGLAEDHRRYLPWHRARIFRGDAP